MTDVVRRLANDDPNDADTWAGTAQVTSANAGTTSDGRRLIGIRWQGVTTTCTYLASYTPVVGHRVTFIKNGPSMVVLGQPATL